MSIVYNGTTVVNPIYNGTELDIVKYGSTTVFERPREIILIDSSSPDYDSTYGRGIMFLGGQTSSAAYIGGQEDGHNCAGWAPAPKTIVVDCTYFNTFEITCLARTVRTCQPWIEQWSNLWCGFRDSDFAVDSSPTGGYGILLMRGVQAPDWTGESVFTPKEGAFYHEDGYVITNYQTLTMDITNLTGTHTFRVWGWVNIQGQSFEMDWYCYVRSLRLYRKVE